MRIDNKKLKELLVEPGHISEVDFKIAIEEAEAQKCETADILIDKNLIKDEQLGRLIADIYNYPFANLREEKIDEETLNMIPEPVARARGLIAFARDKDEIKIGMVDPDNLEIKHIIEKRFGGIVKPYLITKRDAEEALIGYKKSLKEEMRAFTEMSNDPALANSERNKLNVKIVDLLLEHGFYSKASDIHIEPYDKKIVVRFRVDGIMHDVLELPKSFGEQLLSRIKILAKMRIDEHKSAQDGKFRFSPGNKSIDIRVSIVPVTNGENIVMRLLTVENRNISLDDLGLSAGDHAKAERAIKNPHGMLLVTGPTGSGKTTTIYAMLSILNTKDVNVSTIEDPVEYGIEGISQIQVNKRTNLSFAEGLRAIVRQDPDIIMVGEIRDAETAGIAINSAMTGHLVLSTLHANSAASSLPRLIDMGIESFLIASTVRLIIAQRLIRKLCVKCRESYKLSGEEKNIIENNPHVLKALEKRGHGDLDKLMLFRGAGCKVCGQTGYSGRLGIFEVLETNEEIRELIVKKASSDKIKETARKSGMSSILDDGIDKALNGITTIAEVLRVARED